MANPCLLLLLLPIVLTVAPSTATLHPQPPEPRWRPTPRVVPPGRQLHPRDSSAPRRVVPLGRRPRPPGSSALQRPPPPPPPPTQPPPPGSCDPDTPTLPCGYQAWPAMAKADYLWSRVSATPYTPATLPTNAPTATELAQLANSSFDALSFTHRGDEMIVGRRKVIHPFGVVARAQLDLPPGSPYTGVLRCGGLGLIRLSWTSFNPSAVVPSIALKILIDGRPSVNFHALHDPAGQGTNQNFFLNPVSNIFPPTSQNIVADAFDAAIASLPGGVNDRPELRSLLGLWEQASISTNGQPEQNVVAPYQIQFVPTPQITASQADNGDHSQDFRTKLSAIPERTVLYTVVAYKKGSTNGLTIGRVVQTSPFIASKYGDEELYFQHASKRWH
ncbi:hypothetical protein BV898_15940 [Hypsibius exemplaris]|uniref:Uncharacterized protein n=1 Tax=Hypsibius exemplaris TaxID=2072580 RepID=A0A9X6NL24_HYPEX|nr:hypothetical protein BV898_15940 [Hypsibius exemplaris]